MCLSKAYVDRNGEIELLMQEIASLEVKGDKLLLTTLFGEQKEIGANIRKIDFMTHSIVLQNLDKPGEGNSIPYRAKGVK